MDKKDQAEVTMKLEEVENIKFEYVRNVQKTTPHTNFIPDSDNELAKKITQIINIYGKSSSFKSKPSFKKWCNF